MPYTLTIFRDLIGATTSWQNLKEYVMSDAGGRLIVNESDCGRYAIIHYDKKISNMSMQHVQWFRSVVWDISLNRPISVAPPKASGSESANITSFQHYLDGININVYRGKSESTLQLATRTSFGAKGKFYSKRSFAELFGDCFSAASPDVKNIIDYNNMQPGADEVGRFISVLIQHPEHRIVDTITSPAMWLLHVGIVREDGVVLIDEGVCTIPDVERPIENESQQGWFERVSANKDWRWRGVVLKDGTGNRWRIKSSAYQMVRYLRGNTPRFAELFFSLRLQNLVTTYLVYYPECTDEFTSYEKSIRNMSYELNKYYSNVYKNKTITMDAVPSHWHIHLKGLHHKYKTDLKTQGKKITKDVVVDYMNSLPVPRILFLLKAVGV
jgi:hypothetical protein